MENINRDPNKENLIMKHSSNKSSGLRVLQNSASLDNIHCGKSESFSQLNKKSKVSTHKKSTLSVYTDAAQVKVAQTYADKSTNTEEPQFIADECSIEYWKELAETRREALADTLRENEQLYKQVADLSKTVADLKEEATHYEALAEKAELLANIMMDMADATNPDDAAKSENT
ncbi:hypothetical protein EB796_024062 [Bugula neritina]|uniref:Geminin n=1 Tax=Bugula neritina TaxID=10212 RepID=A0A7J7IVP8_BUGNE|nr:hypothetical protein EB796_024062 [Bugula neritina]